MTEPRRQAGDVVDLLQRQHVMIRRLCESVAGAPPAERNEPFKQLLRLMAVHEAVEEEIVHPFVRRRLPDGNTMVAERLHEEHDAKRMLVALDALGPSSAGFTELFDRYRTALFAHIEQEEASEFAGLREKTRPAERSAMAAAVKVASVLAPTHPHPGVESAALNLLIGTPLAMIDRARDMIRQAMAPKPATGVTGEAPAGGAPPPGGPSTADTGAPAGAPTAAGGGEPADERSGGVYTPGAPGTTGPAGGTAGPGAGGAEGPANDPTTGTAEPGTSGRPIPPG
jgi:hypothetical protein